MTCNPIFNSALYFSQLSQELGWQGKAAGRDAAGIENAWPAFRNIAYPLAATPLVLDADWDLQHRERVRAYMQLLEKTIGLCVDHPAMSDYLGHSAMERQFIRTPLKGPRYVQICRLDGYVERHTGALKILEHNSDSPAGIVFTPRLNGLVRELWRQFGAPGLEGALAERQFDDPTLVQAFFSAVATVPGACMVILQEAGKSNAESREMAVAFSAAGLDTRVCDPRQIELDGKSVLLDGRPVAVIWNKINTVYWRQYVERNQDQAAKWLNLLETADVMHLNHFGARLVTENKRCLSLMQEPRFGHHFTAAERALIAELQPWATKFEAGKRVSWEGENVDVLELVATRREHFVIKEPYDIRGDGVTVGLDVSAAEWAAKAEQAVAEGFVLQQYIAPLQLPVSHAQHWNGVRISNLSLDSFVFGGQVGGYGAKASTNHRVNLFKGGQKVAVLVGK